MASSIGEHIGGKTPRGRLRFLVNNSPPMFCNRMLRPSLSGGVSELFDNTGVNATEKGSEVSWVASDNGWPRVFQLCPIWIHSRLAGHSAIGERTRWWNRAVCDDIPEAGSGAELGR